MRLGWVLYLRQDKFSDQKTFDFRSAVYVVRVHLAVRVCVRVCSFTLAAMVH